jgi:hypothetical protein
MVINFKYCGLDVKLNLVEAADTEVNPVPIMDALIKMINAISYFHEFELVITSKENEDGN